MFYFGNVCLVSPCPVKFPASVISHSALMCLTCVSLSPSVAISTRLSFLRLSFCWMWPMCLCPRLLGVFAALFSGLFCFLDIGALICLPLHLAPNSCPDYLTHTVTWNLSHWKFTCNQVSKVSIHLCARSLILLTDIKSIILKMLPLFWNISFRQSTYVVVSAKMTSKHILSGKQKASE